MAEDAVKIMRELVKSSPREYSLRSLATYLNMLSAHLGNAGRVTEALIIRKEADCLLLA